MPSLFPFTVQSWSSAQREFPDRTQLQEFVHTGDCALMPQMGGTGDLWICESPAMRHKSK